MFNGEYTSDMGKISYEELPAPHRLAVTKSFLKDAAHMKHLDGPTSRHNLHRNLSLQSGHGVKIAL